MLEPLGEQGNVGEVVEDTLRGEDKVLKEIRHNSAALKADALDGPVGLRGVVEDRRKGVERTIRR